MENKSKWLCEFEGCGLYLNKPVTLPCGYTVCKEHLDCYQDEFKCPVCGEEHQVPRNGFGLNKKMLNLIESNKHLTGRYMEAQTRLEELEKLVEKCERSDLDGFVYEHFFETRNKLDLHRETMIKEINSKYEKYLSKLNELEKQCRKKSDSIGKLDLSEVNTFLTSVKNEFRRPHLTEKEIQTGIAKLEKNIESIKSKVTENINRVFEKSFVDFQPSNSLNFGKLVNRDFGFESGDTASSDTSLIRSFEGHYQSVNTIQLVEDQNLLISGSEDNSINIWNINSGECLRQIPAAHPYGVTFIQLVTDDIFVSGSSHKSIEVWDLNTLENLHTLYNKCAFVSMCRLKENELACGHGNGFISTWDLDEYTKTTYFKAHNSPITVLKLTNDSKVLISAAGKVIKLWNKESLNLINTLEDHPNCIFDIDLKENSNFELFTCCDTSIRLYNMKTGRCLSEFEFDNSVYRIKSLSNGLIIVGFDSKDESNLLIYDLNERQIVKKLIGHTDSILDLKVFSHGDKLLSSSSDGSIKLWQI